MLHLALLVGLLLDPAAHDLLFAAHVLHKALDAFGQIGHRGRGALRRTAGAAAAFMHGGRQAFDGDAQVLARGSRAFANVEHARIEVGDRREPVFQLGIELVLRLSGLQVEEAQDQ